MDAYLVCIIPHNPKDNITNRIYFEYKEYFGKTNAGWPLEFFEMGSIKIIQALVALGVLRIKNDHWYVDTFGKYECDFYIADDRELKIYIPVEL